MFIDAIIDSHVRVPSSTGTGERYLEFIIAGALQQLILVDGHPRCAYQVTLQVTQSPRNDNVNGKVAQAQVKLASVPALLHAAMLALLAASVPLKEIATCVVVATPGEALRQEPIGNPPAVVMREAKSLHLLGFASNGGLLLAESEGECTLEEWARGYLLSWTEEENPDHNNGPNMGQLLRTLVKAKTALEAYW
ncbi:hypothetical protein ACRALDRAFT_2033853 [Sodiomyces alcalophilus JCM 7366]|uniref:uncharacterized protein n=1 Tax=Sodiomyces alcalophilus JCM 7366 TaxID=591952 RepID=UPI0039B58202